MIHPTLSVKLNEDGEYDGIQVKAGLAVKSFKTTGFTSDFESAWLFAKVICLSEGMRHLMNTLSTINLKTNITGCSKVQSMRLRAE